MRKSQEEGRAVLFERLRERQPEIEQAALTRMEAVAETSPAADPEYRDGLRATIASALEYGIVALERGEEAVPAIPMTLLVQARLAARSRIGLDTVLRRYFAGYTLLGDFVIEESERGGLLDATLLKRLMRAYGGLFDRVIAAVTEEYKREEGKSSSPEGRRADRVRMLLAGELVDAAELEYDFEARHVCLIAAAPDAEVRPFAVRLDCRLLLVRPGEGTTWAWLGFRHGVDLAELQRLIASAWPPSLPLALGEPARGLVGWRLTFRQARAALPIAMRSAPRFARYGDVALQASMLQDELLTTSLREMYLAPLSRERDGGRELRRTLRAYFAAGRNGASAAAALRVSRQTVSNRLQAIERLLDRPLSSCAAEVEAALGVEELQKLRSGDGIVP